MLQSYCGANISSVKIVFQNGNSYILHLATLFILLTLISYDGLFVCVFYFISFTF